MWHSVSPTSNANANYKRRGGDEPLRGAHSVLPAPAATIDRLGTALNNLTLAAATTPPSYSSLRLQTWHSPRQITRSQRPTISSRRLWPKSLQPRRELLDHLGPPTNRSLGIIVGLVATASVSITQVQHEVARPRATRTRQRPPTQWEVAKPTKNGTYVAPDGVGGQI